MPAEGVPTDAEPAARGSGAQGKPQAVTIHQETTLAKPPVMLVTGSRRGIGAATAIEAASQGFAVCVNDDKDDGQAERIVEVIRERGGQAILALGSVAVEADVVRVFATIDRQLGPVTALVNNAAVVGKPGRVEDQTGEALRALFAVNILGYILCAREAIRRMSTEHGGEGGSIVNVSSAGAREGGAGILVPYCATKGAVDTLTIGLAEEVGPEGIRVNAVRPGTIDTPIQADVGFPDLAAVEGPKSPLRRAGTPQEVAAVIVWLCSDRAAYVSRAIVDVTGGE